MSTEFSVYNEIGKLRKVLLHRPGIEIDNLAPEMMERLLFDDIPYLETAQKEHDAFAELLRSKGAEVVYLEDLVAKVLEDRDVRKAFIKEYIAEAYVFGERVEQLMEYYMSFSNMRELTDILMGGLRRKDFPTEVHNRLSEMINADYPFIVDPIVNLYFTRDTFAVIGQGVSINKMATLTRSRETLFAKYIFKYHPDFKDVVQYYGREEFNYIEGGDILILSDKVLAVGMGERTSPDAVEQLARRVLDSNEPFSYVLAFSIPKKRAFMHLDTVFTMVDRNIFTIHPEIEGPLAVYSIFKRENELVIEKEEGTLEDILMKYLELDSIRLIRCGGGRGIDASREQWNDGSNTLAISPGEVIVYVRNKVTNRLLEEEGVILHKIASSELSRGRGGPRCMSMPLRRDDVNK